jgi:hypothetical protein
MLRSQAMLCESTGSLEMLVFQMLSAGNIGQPGAPGTVVDLAAAASVGEASGDTHDADAAADDADAAADDADAAAGDASCEVVAVVVQPLTSVTATTAAVARRRTDATSGPSGEITVASWHGHSGRASPSCLFRTERQSTTVPRRCGPRPIPGGPVCSTVGCHGGTVPERTGGP